MKKRRSLALPLFFVAALAGGAGWIAGRASVPAPPPPAPAVSFVSCDEPKSPVPQGSSALAAVHVPRRPKPPKDVPAATPLPPLPSADEQRERLLAYVRDRAGSLRDCAGDARERVRLTIRLEVAGKGNVRKVEVLEDDAALKVAGACVSQRMSQWVLPEEWVRADRTLLVAVVL